MPTRPRAGHHSLGKVIRYLLWYWAPGPLWLGLLVVTAATAAALAVAIGFASLTATTPEGGDRRRFLFAALWISARSRRWR